MPALPRRRLLAAGAAVAAGTAAVVGTGAGDHADRLAARFDRPADRQVPFDRSPPPGTWPLPRYDAANTAAPPDATPPTARPETLWSYATAESGASVVAGADRVFVGGRDRLLALDRATGELRWAADAGGSPRLVAGRVYAVGGDAEELVALDAADGTVDWRTSLASSDGSVLVEGEGVVYLRTRRALYGFHADSGVRLFRLDRGPVGRSSPTVAGGRLLAVDGRRAVAYRPPSGPSAVVDPTPVVVAERSIDWHSAGGWSPTMTRVAVDGTPVVGVAGFDADTGRIHRFSVADGVERTIRTPLDGVTAPAVADDTLYTVSYSASGDFRGGYGGYVLASDRRTGDERWRRAVSHFVSGTAVANGVVVVGGANPAGPEGAGVYAFDAATGQRLWRTDGRGGTGGYSLAPVGSRLLVADGEGVRLLG